MSSFDNQNEIINTLKETRQFRETIQNKQDVFEIITTIKQTPKNWSFASIVNLNGQYADEFTFPDEKSSINFDHADSPPAAFLKKAAQAHLDQSQKVREFIGKGTGDSLSFSKWLIAILIIGVLVAVGVGIWFYHKEKTGDGGEPTPTPTVTVSVTPNNGPTPIVTPALMSGTPVPLPPLPNDLIVKDWLSWFVVEYRAASADKSAILADHGVMFTGDAYKITLTTLQNGNFYLFQLDSSGRARRLFPMKEFDGIVLNNENPLPATANKILPSDKQSFELDDVAGTEAFYLCAYPQRQDWLEDPQRALTSIQELLQHTGNVCATMLTFEHHAKK